MSSSKEAPNKRPVYDEYSDDDDIDIDSSFGGDASPVTLGFADGALPKNEDESSSVDKIGGSPSFWPVFQHSAPQSQAGLCKECGAAMPLLAQINAPLDPEQCIGGSVTEEEDRIRVLYVFGCVQKCCANKPNSLRVFRAVRRVAPKAPQEEPKPASNPFALNASTAPGAGDAFDFGNAIFGSGPTDAPVIPDADDSEDEDEDEGPPPPSNRWDLPNQPKLPAQYVATEPEPGSSSSDAKELKSFAEATQAMNLNAAKQPSSSAQASRRGSGSKHGDGAGNWTGESYERQQLPIGVDEVFYKFEERMMRHGGDVASQIMRYHRPEGQPLPYAASGEAFSKLWTSVEGQEEGKRVYDESGVDKCEGCGAPRMFELQLMPQLVTKLSESGPLKVQEEDMALGWATAWVFACAADCGLPEGGPEVEGETWKEEVVLVQFEEDSEAFKEAQKKQRQQQQQHQQQAK